MTDMLTVVEPMIPALRRYARGLVANATLADDLVQDCLEKVVANWHGRRNNDARAWVFAILHNVAISQIRQTARRGIDLPIDDAHASSIALAAGQDEALYGKEVLAAIERLPADHRSVILLVSVEDLSYEQVAQILGVPVGTVMSRLSRAREGLRHMLDDPRPAQARASAHLKLVRS